LCDSLAWLQSPERFWLIGWSNVGSSHAPYLGNSPDLRAPRATRFRRGRRPRRAIPLSPKRSLTLAELVDKSTRDGNPEVGRGRSHRRRDRIHAVAITRFPLGVLPIRPSVA
jgi:hypothetical protein